MEILGIDVGGSGIKGAIVNARTGELTSKRERFTTPQPATPSAIAETIAELVRHFDFHGPVGVAFPARIKNGVAQTAANIDDSWIGTDAASLFSRVTGCSVSVINDADAAGVAAMAYGAGMGHTGIVLLLTFGTGIGSALFVDGVLVPNTELGHLYLKNMDAEQYASDRARKVHRLSWKAWAKRVQEYLDHVEFLFAPDLIIIGGGVSKPKRKEKYFEFLETKAQLVTAELQNHAGIVGAAMAAYQIQGLQKEVD